ncbi:Type II secretion system protein K [Salinisphaera shabanensis E1L3A]|uniref:Type II secretion system protein K n=1 Tax=Salinisphaera shabanensis E1L3A TaxID=1033802 RepID=U2FU71_9GAMM|nr:type II secretion system minor pseudopilin GspK [Salinisphaera shabanensis]ERJ17923.1 Type II secretion system protein K [Salinisphaera shabanensis E1L3A]
MKPDRYQRGVALLTAMLIVALVAIIGASMLSQMNLALHRSGNIWQSEQAWWYAVGIENWLGKLLRQDAENSDIDSLDEAWAQPVDYLPLDGGALQGRLIDLQGRFNLNNLSGSDVDAAQEQFQRLIELVADTDQITARTIAASTRDWLDADINPTLPDGAEDDYYLGLNPAYRTANTLMASASELRLVKGVTPAIYAALQPYICALPQLTAINVNTAPAPILATLAPELPASTGEALVESRADEPWESIDAFLQDPALAGRDIDANRLDVVTHYFLATGQITVDRAQIQFFSVLERGDNGAVRTLRHSTNVE